MKKKIICLLLALYMCTSFQVMNTYALEVSAYDADAAVAYAGANWSSVEGVCDEFVKSCLNAGGLNLRAGGVEPLKNALIDSGAGSLVKLSLDADGVYINVKDNPSVKVGDIMFFYCEEHNVWIHTAIVCGFDENGNVQAYAHNPGWDKMSAFGRLSFTRDEVTHKDGMRFFAVQMNATGSHVHNWAQDLYEDEHPHHMFDRCTGCNAMYYLGWNATVSTCTVCNPPLGDIPEIIEINYDEKSESIQLKWSTVYDAIEYEVLRADSTGIYHSLGKTKAVTMSNQSIEAGTTYYYKIKAYLKNGTVTEESEVKSCIVPGMGATKAEVTAVYDETSGNVKLSWTKVTNATGYDVYRAKDLEGTYFKLNKNNLTGLSFTNTSVDAGETYYYKVVARPSGVESEIKNVVIPSTETETPESDTQKPELPVYTDPVEAFVARLYVECLNRNPEEVGLKDWTKRLKDKELTGVEAASGIVFSVEFRNRNLCNEDYVELLYRAFMGRQFDISGKADWMNRLKNGVSREEVFNGFAMSQEFYKICKNYNINQGKAVTVSEYGTVPKGKCSICGAEDGVTAFIKRFYKIILERNYDQVGLNYWTNQLWNHTNTGRDVAYGFVFSQEFINKKYNDSDYIEHLYLAFFGRKSDKVGKQHWIDCIKDGWTREEVFDGFIGSQEFINICNEYGIVRY